MLLRSKRLIRQPFRAYASNIYIYSNIASLNNSKSVLTPKYSSLISRGKATQAAQAMHVPHLQEEKPFPSILIKGDGELVSKVRCCCFKVLEMIILDEIWGPFILMARQLL